MVNGQLDLFITYLTDTPLKDTRDLMAGPCFALEKRKRLKPIHYRVCDIEIDISTSSEYGMALCQRALI